MQNLFWYFQGNTAACWLLPELLRWPEGRWKRQREEEDARSARGVTASGAGAAGIRETQGRDISWSCLMWRRELWLQWRETRLQRVSRTPLKGSQGVPGSVWPHPLQMPKISCTSRGRDGSRGLLTEAKSLCLLLPSQDMMDTNPSQACPDAPQGSKGRLFTLHLLGCSVVQDERNQLRVKIEKTQSRGGSCSSTDTVPCLPGAVLGWRDAKVLWILMQRVPPVLEGWLQCPWRVWLHLPVTWRSAGPMEGDEDTRGQTGDGWVWQKAGG